MKISSGKISDKGIHDSYRSRKSGRKSWRRYNYKSNVLSKARWHPFERGNKSYIGFLSPSSIRKKYKTDHHLRIFHSYFILYKFYNKVKDYNNIFLQLSYLFNNKHVSKYFSKQMLASWQCWKWRNNRVPHGLIFEWQVNEYRP